HAKIRPMHPDAFRPRLAHLDETILLLASETIKQFRPAIVAFEELKAMPSSGRKFKPRTITSFMRKNETEWEFFPRNDNRPLRIAIRVRRTRKIAFISAEDIVRNFRNAYVRRFSSGEFRHGHRFKCNGADSFRFC